MLFYFDFKPRRKFLPEKPDYSLEKFGHETALFAISIIIFLKSIRHLLKANNNETFKNLRSSDSEDSKLNSFWIFTEISKCEQLYFLFTVFKISSLKNFWMFFQKMYSFMYSYYSYWMSFLLKSSEKVKKLLFFSFYSIFSTPILHQTPTDMSWNGFSHSVPGMFHISRSRDIRTRLFWSYQDLIFEKYSETSQF